jgi:hypothetical protein
LKIDDDALPTPPDTALVAELNCPNATPPNKLIPNPIANAARTSRRVRKRLPQIPSEDARVVYSLSRAQRYTPAVPQNSFSYDAESCPAVGPAHLAGHEKHTQNPVAPSV